jgi:Na+-transporting NADH:ubiquinone oxidoreductase subunit B
LVVVSYGVGLAVEFVFAIIKGHEVEEGYLVTGMLVPLIVPVDIPLWMLAVAVIFGVVIGKEVFGGTGMNILNPALTIRAFLFLHIQHGCLVIRSGYMVRLSVQERLMQFLVKPY